MPVNETLPKVEFKVMLGAVMLVNVVSVKPAEELTVAALPALIPPLPMVTDCPETDEAESVTL